MANGTIKQQPPSMVKLESEIANKIANVVTPPQTSDIFSQLQQAQSSQPGYADPRSQLATGPGIGGRISEPGGTTALRNLQTQLMSNNPNSNLGASEASRMGIPSLSTPPAKGIATSASHAFHDCSSHFQEVEGGVGMAAQKGNTQFVDDKGWPVTLKQILGSRMLSAQQLKAASIDNVRKMIQVSGGSAKDRTEVHYMFQRMMLEGFIRGVDITADIRKGGAPKVKLYDYSALGVSRTAGSKNLEVVLDLPFWKKSSEMNKYMLFTHEFGHNLLNKSHTGIGMTKNPGIMNQRLNSYNAKKMLTNKGAYNALMDDLFSPRGSKNYNHLRSAITRNSDATYDPKDYPSLSGVDRGYSPNSGGAAGTPSMPEGVGGDQYSTTTTNTTNNMFTITPPTIDMAEQKEMPGGGPATQRQAQVADNTITAPTGLSGDIQTATSTFAAGMADLSKQGPDMDRAGVLLKSG